MLRLFRQRYPQKGRLIYFLFDISFLLYLTAYFTYYQEQVGYSKIRLIGTLAILISGVLVLTMTTTKGFRINKYTAWYFLFILFGIISAIWAKYDDAVFSILPSMIRVLLIGVFLYARVQRVEDVENLLFFYLITVLYMDLFVGKMMIDYYSLSAFFLKRFGDNFFYNSNAIAVLNVFAILIVIYFFRRHTGRLTNILHIILSLFFLSVLFLTESKKGILGLLLGVVIFFYQKVKGVKRLERMCIGLMFIFATIRLVIDIPFLNEIIGYRIEEALDLFTKTGTGDVSSQNRVGLIGLALQMWSDHPILGLGMNNFPMFQTIGEAGYYAHNNYVELLADLGLVGFCLYYYMPMSLLRRRIDNKNNIQVLMKTIVIITLFFDLGVVSYQDIRIQLFVCVSYIVLVKLNTLYRVK